MNIGLILPSQNDSREPGMPLGLGYLASYLKAHQDAVEIDILDMAVSTPEEEAAFFLKPHAVVGVSVNFSTFNLAVETARRIKSANPQAVCVAGGPYVSMALEEALAPGCFDFGVFGEGEVTFNALVAHLRSGAAKEELTSVDGLILRLGNTVLKTAPRALVQDLDRLPSPAYELFRMDRYPELYVSTLRGCPYNCVFCSSGQIWGRKYRRRSVETVLEEVGALTRRYPLRPVRFVDDSFNADRRWLDRFCDGLIEGGRTLLWSCEGFRIEKIDEALARKLVLSGCTHLSIGIESSDPAVLKAIRKNLTPEVIEEKVRLCTKMGLPVRGQFMIGNPGDTLETVRESIRFASRIGLASAAFYPAQPFPSTGLWDFAKQHGRFLVAEEPTNYASAGTPVLFETDDFPREHRFEAIAMAEQYGYFYRGDRPKRQTLGATLAAKVLAVRLGRRSLEQLLRYGLALARQAARRHRLLKSSPAS